MAVYMLLFFLVTYLLTPFGTATSNPDNQHHLQQIHQFPNGSWAENIAIRPNGNLLITVASTSELWEVIPRPQPQPANQARLIHHFTNAQMATGITEIAADVYAVATPKSAWRVDFNNNVSPRPVQIATIPTAGSLNGMDTLNHATGTVAIADSEAGLVWKLDTSTGEYTVMLQDPTMAANAKMGPLLGINGIKVHNGYVYYVNTPERLFCRIPVNPVTGHQLGPREIISQGVLGDDFAISEHGVAYLAGFRDNVVTRVFLDGRREVVAGSEDSRVLMSATSAALGVQGGSDVLYITTGGETAEATNSTASRGGKVMVVRLD